MLNKELKRAIQLNCDISDAKGCRMYSLCTLFLRLRNLYKWEKQLDPWHEPDSPELLDWIAAKEEYWQRLEDTSYHSLALPGSAVDPFQLTAVNEHITASGLVYGAGYGRSMKPIFFLAEHIENKSVEGCSTIILGRELTRELAAPFAMLQEDIIYIRREPFRYYLWDQINDIRPSGKSALNYALQYHGLLDRKGLLDRDLLQQNLEQVVDQELTTFIYHEVGEIKDNSLDRAVFRKLVATFTESPIELVARATKDVLADTHPSGMLSYIIEGRKEGSLGFYLTFLDGLRKVLFPEIAIAFQQFLVDRKWETIARARDRCREENRIRADLLSSLGDRLDVEPAGIIRKEIEEQVLEPLGI